MSEDKRNRIVAAVTVNSIILIVIIAVVLVYQMVEMGILFSRKSAIEEQIQQYEEQIDEAEDLLEYYQTEDYLRDQAYKYGFRDSD